MIAPDVFCQHYAEFLDDTYDVVDRLVLNAYFSLGQSCGGFRNWWRVVHGSDETLDNTHLMRMAGRFARRVRGWAEKNVTVHTQQSTSFDFPYQAPQQLFLGVFAQLCR